ncbi:hypothetical protein LTR49_022553 [Elasticomyces elasticus]|nr:hypothetical protein LTR49_022553 [Elasticomyces elasticus]KAK5736291.1 hypothetical protein LTS12_026228 [Elasticomyces elasticus]
MSFRLPYLYVVLLAFLLTLVQCRESSGLDRHLDGFLKLRQDTPADYDPSEDPPACFTLCGKLPPGSNAKRSLCSRGASACGVLEERSLDMILSGDNTTNDPLLARRTLSEVTGDTVDQYMESTYTRARSELRQRADLDASQLDVTDGDAGTETLYFVSDPPDNTGPFGAGQNTAMWQAYGDTPYNMVTKYIHGCTKGNWCGHFWQYITFSKTEGFPTPNFNTYLLNAITGRGTNNVVGPSLQSVADQFTINDGDADDQKNTVHAAIMSPRGWRSGKVGQFQYPSRIPKIKEAINQVIPALPVDNIAAYDYVPVDADPNDEDEDPSDLDNTARGRVAFQFDPDADGQGSKGTRLLYERGELPGQNLFEDIWTQNPS